MATRWADDYDTIRAARDRIRDEEGPRCPKTGGMKFTTAYDPPRPAATIALSRPIGLGPRRVDPPARDTAGRDDRQRDLRARHPRHPPGVLDRKGRGLDLSVIGIPISARMVIPESAIVTLTVVFCAVPIYTRSCNVDR
jgi:hypothetical protein